MQFTQNQPVFAGISNNQFPFPGYAAKPFKDKKRAQIMYIFLYSLFNLGCSMSLMFVMSLQLPTQLKFMLGNDSSLMLGIIVSLSSIANIFGSILSGILADKTNLHVPIIIVGNLLWSATIVVRCFAAKRTLWIILLYGLITMIGMFLYAFVEVPYTALLPALFQKRSYGTVSGSIGFTMLIGTAIGIAGLGLVYELVGEIFLSVLSAIFINFLSLSLLPLMSRKKGLRNNPYYFHEEIQRRDAHEALMKKAMQEESGKISKPKSKKSISIWNTIARNVSEVLYPFLKPFSHKNYTLIVLVRFWMYMSLATIQSFTLYFIQDVVDRESDGSYSVFGYNFIKNSEQALALFAVTILITALFSTVFFGWLSDRYSQKKYYVFLACVIGSILQIIIVFTHNYNVMLLCALFIGICIGTFVSIDMALANEVLPEKDEAGKDLAIYASAKTLPILFATPIAGFLLYLGNNYVHLSFIPKESFGYYLIYLLSSVFALMSGLCVVFINNTKPIRIIYGKLVLD